jgi:hypothetical protein
MARVISERNREQVTSTCKEKKEITSQRRQLHSEGMCHRSHDYHCTIKMSITYLLSGTPPTTFSMADTRICVRDMNASQKFLTLERKNQNASVCSTNVRKTAGKLIPTTLGTFV